jgi:hypothetical protein
MPPTTGGGAWHRLPLPPDAHFHFSLRGKFARCAGNFAPKFCTTRCAVGAGATAGAV